MNKNENKTTVNGGIGFTGLLTVLFIALKLVGVISWRWVWILSPLWISAGLVIIVLVVFFFVCMTPPRKRK